METRSFRIDGEGRFFSEVLYSQEIEVTDAVAKAFQQGQLLTLHNVGSITTEDGTKHFLHVKHDTSTGWSYWTVQLTCLHINSAFRTIGEGKDAFLSPKFRHGGSDPVMSVPWYPGAMDEKGVLPIVTLVISVKSSDLSSGKQYLFAFDVKGNAYKMPMSNLYDTCELCCGQFDSYGSDQIDCVRKALEQFRKGAWNADLYSESLEESTKNFFRLHPEKEGFSTMPIVGSWTKWCVKVSTPTVKFACV